MKRDANWLSRQQQDQFVKKARKFNYRSRAVFKLQEIDEKYHLIKPGQIIFDLGAAPGSWSQYISQKVGSNGKVIAVDILDMQPIKSVQFIQGDFSEESVYEQCLSQIDNHQADLVISDMAPNLTGIRDVDQARSMSLSERVLDFSRHVLRSQGDIVIKLFQGKDTDKFKTELSEKFQRVTVCKPNASRDSSREFYILARGYKV